MKNSTAQIHFGTRQLCFMLIRIEHMASRCQANVLAIVIKSLTTLVAVGLAPAPGP